MANFEETPQFVSGQSVAEYMDRFFRVRGWKVIPTTPHEERVLCLGDRHFLRDGDHYHVEYKSGIQTHYTGNVFLETVSVDSAGKAGWVYTCQADYIFYAALLDGKILIFKPEKLREEIEGLKLRFKTVKTSNNQNSGYNTHGVIVPFEYAEKHLTCKVIEIPKAA